MALLGERPCDAERHAAGENGHLVQRVGMRQDRGEHGVSALVVRRGSLLFGIEDQAFTASTEHDAVARVLEVDALDVGRATANGEQRCFVHEVGKVGATHSRRGLGHRVEIDVVAHALPSRVNLEDCQTLFHFGEWNDDLAVEAAGTQQGGVENVGPVGGRHHDDSFGGLEAIHLGEHLVERLFALVVTTTESGTALATDGVDFVDEDDRAAHLRGLLEQVADAACTDANEHFHEVRSGDRKEPDTRFTGDCAREQRLARSRRTDQQDSLRHTRTDFLEALGHLQEVDDFLDLLLHTGVTRNVGERRARLVGVVVLGLASTDRHDVAGLSHCTALHPQEERHDQEEGQEQRDQVGEEVPRGRDVVVVDALFLEQLFVGIRQRGGAGRFEGAAVAEFSADDVGKVVDGDALHFTVVDQLEELGVGHLGGGRCWPQAWTNDQRSGHRDECPNCPLGHRGLLASLTLVLVARLSRRALRGRGWRWGEFAHEPMLRVGL